VTPGPAAPAVDPATSALRLDAGRNRERILDAAQQVFAEHGLDGSIAEIARRAGVGVATVYRRFPTRDDLIEGVFAQKLARCVSVMNEALADPDPWLGFRGCLEAICLMQAEDRGFSDLMIATVPRSIRMQADHDRATSLMREIVDRARASGRLRPDFRAEDVPMLLLANQGVLAAVPQRGDLWRRLVAYMLQAFECTDAGELPNGRPEDPATC
jgi:AcrR family transcriptional regulator